MSEQKRNRRLRFLIARLNKERKKQARQIDILCNDLIAAQKHFIKSLKVIGFASDFYEAILGLTELNELLITAGNLIKDQVAEVNIAFFLLQNSSFEMHIFESEQTIDLNDKRLENFFTLELVENIAQSNRICSMEDMLTLGLQGNPLCLEKVSMAGLPLNCHGSALGFVLLYRSSKCPLTPEELQSIDHISAGLARAIDCCQSLVASA